MRHRRLVVLGWLLVVVAGTSAWGAVSSRLDRDWASAPHESMVGSQLLADGAAYSRAVDAVVDGVPAGGPALREALAAARTDLLALPGVACVLDPSTAPERVATDRRAVLVTVGLAKDLPVERLTSVQRGVERRLRAIATGLPGARVVIGGGLPTQRAVTDQTTADTRQGELIALPLSLVLLCVLFRGFAAALVPLFAAVSTIATGLLSLLALSYVRALDSTQLSVTTVIGLGLAIDYSLLQVDRFREERARGLPVDEAVAAAMGTAGRTILYSALTVATALCGLWVFPSPFYVSIGLAGGAVVLGGVSAALTLTPAALAIFADRIGVARAAGSDDGFFARLARRTRRRALPIALVVAFVLAALAAPFSDVRLVNSEAAQILTPASEPRQHADLVRDRFPACRSDVVVVVARTDPARLATWASTLVGAPSVHRVSPVTASPGGLAVVHVEPVDSPGQQVADDLVTRIREHRPPTFPIWVTGQAAIQRDFSDEVIQYAPRAALVVVLATFLLLLMMTGSVLVPLKALVMNTLSLGASFGALVVVFQEGHGSHLLGVTTNAGGIQTWVPVVVFVFAFGLSMDYEMFLVARIKELRDGGLGNDEAVERGLQRSGRIITSAATLMVVVFSGFAAGDTLAVKQVGLALALAVVLDATLVRCLLVPATMTLLGNLNWWAPAPLVRLRAHLPVHG